MGPREKRLFFSQRLSRANGRVVRTIVAVIAASNSIAGLHFTRVFSIDF